MEAEQKTSGGASDSAAKSAGPNPEAVAWYVRQAEALLRDLRSRAEALRSRGNQLAGFSAAVVALVGGNADRLLSGLEGPPRIVAGVALLLGAGFLISTLVASILSGPLRPEHLADISAREIANFTTERFISEPHLWRIQIRTIRGLLDSIGQMTHRNDRAAATLRWAGLLFLAGLLAVGSAFALAIFEVTF